MAVDALAPYVTRTLAAMILTVYGLGKSLSSTRKDFNNLCHLNVDKQYKKQIYIHIS